MTNKKISLYSFILFLASVWWGWTVLIDFVVVKTIFSHIDIFFKAGNIGVALFSQLNELEILVSTFILALISFELKKNKMIKVEFIISCLCWLITIIYFSYLTPKLVLLTELWEKAELMGLSSIAGIPDIQQEHQFYHRVYIIFDTIKLVLLSGFIFLGIWKQEKWD